jgi:hypothetical protein
MLGSKAKATVGLWRNTHETSSAANSATVRSPQSCASNVSRGPGEIDNLRPLTFVDNRRARQDGTRPLGEQNRLCISPCEGSVGKRMRQHNGPIDWVGILGAAPDSGRIGVGPMDDDVRTAIAIDISEFLSDKFACWSVEGDFTLTRGPYTSAQDANRISRFLAT